METFYGYITSFNYQTIQGRVALTTRTFRFGDAIWDGGLAARSPRKGEQVAVVFDDDGHLVSVRALPA